MHLSAVNLDQRLSGLYAVSLACMIPFSPCDRTAMMKQSAVVKSWEAAEIDQGEKKKNTSQKKKEEAFDVKRKIILDT